MERDDKASSQDAAVSGNTERGWTQRYAGPIRYRRLTALDGGGRPSIIFKFALPPGQTELSTEVYQVLADHKYLERSSDHGGGRQPTGLVFTRDRAHGRVWRLPDNPTGRFTADILDARLGELAEKLSQESDRAR